MAVKITLEEIDVNWLKPVITSVLQGDTDLVEKYCAITDKMSNTVQYIYNQVKDALAKNEGACYQVIAQDENEINYIGYVVIVQHGVKKILYSYAINKSFRNKDVHIGWLRRVLALLGPGYLVPIWKKNQRALNFFMIKNNFQLFDVGAKFVTLQQV